MIWIRHLKISCYQLFIKDRKGLTFLAKSNSSAKQILAFSLYKIAVYVTFLVLSVEPFSTTTISNLLCEKFCKQKDLTANSNDMARFNVGTMIEIMKVL